MFAGGAKQNDIRRRHTHSLGQNELETPSGHNGVRFAYSSSGLHACKPRRDRRVLSSAVRAVLRHASTTCIAKQQNCGSRTAPVQACFCAVILSCGSQTGSGQRDAGQSNARRRTGPSDRLAAGHQATACQARDEPRPLPRRRCMNLQGAHPRTSVNWYSE